MEEILQDPEELLREREKPPAKPVKKFVSPVPYRQSGRLRSSERVAVAGKDGERGVTESPPITKLVSKNPLREPWIFVQGKDHTKDHYRPLTDKEWIKWRNEDTGSFDDRYEICEESPAMYRERSSTSRLQETRNPYKSQWIGTKLKGRNEANSSANSSWKRMAPSHSTTSDETWSDASFSPHGTGTTQRRRYRFSAIDNKRSLEDYCHYHASQQVRLGQRQTETPLSCLRSRNESLWRNSTRTCSHRSGNYGERRPSHAG